MSDHEDIGQDDWEEGTLPDIPGADTSYARSESLMKPSRNLAVRSRGPVRDGTRARLPGFFRHGDPARDDRYSRRPHTHPTDGIPGRATGIESRQARTTQANRETEKKRIGPPTRTYAMRVTWYTLLSNIKSDHMHQAKIARMRLDEIAASTDTYIETPSPNSTDIWIWGATDQAAAAHDLLSIWESEVRETRAPRENWFKQHAVDGRVEERKERQVMYQQIKDQWKEDAVGHSIELILIWNHTIGLEDFQEEHAWTMRDLEEAYQSRIVCDRISSKVHVFGHDHNSAYEVHNRVVNIAREMVAKRNEVIRANFLRYPLHGTYRSSVQLIKDDRSDNFFPSLCGTALEHDAIARYQAFFKSANHDTRVKVRRHIERSLSGRLQLSSKHVRMRVSFLDLAFHQYKRPSDTKPYHDFHEYVAMIGNERTTIKAQGLRNNGKDFSKLGDKLSELLGQPDIAYAVHFDFGMGAVEKGATLRFECDLRPSYMEGEVEKTAQRWLEHRSEAMDDLLLINVLDFERPGYQIAIRAVPFLDNRATQADMDLFARSVEFTPPLEGIKAPPKRRAKFPPGRQTLKMVSEMTILKWICKERGVFELRRRDSYLVNSDSKAITTDWSACYYYHEWDNMMGKFGDLQPGQDVDFNRSVTTFFPVENHEGLEAGLKRFTNEIEEHQALLRLSIDKLPELKIDEPSQLPTPPPEVNGGSQNLIKGDGKALQQPSNNGARAVNGDSAHTDKGKDKSEDEQWSEVNAAKPNCGPTPNNRGKGQTNRGQSATTNQAKPNGGPAFANRGKGKAINTSPNTSRKRPEPRKNKYEVLKL